MLAEAAGGGRNLGKGRGMKQTSRGSETREFDLRNKSIDHLVKPKKYTQIPVSEFFF